MKRPIAPKVRKLLQWEDLPRGSCAALALGMDTAVALYHLHGQTLPGFRPGAGGTAGAWKQIDPMRKDSLRRLSPGTLAAVSALAWKLGKARESAGR